MLDSIFMFFFLFQKIGIHSLSQLDDFPVGAVAYIVIDATNMGSFARNICTSSIHGCAMGSMPGAISNVIEKRSTTFATGLSKIQN